MEKVVLSEEQEAILECVKKKQNTVVDACAGTGKTTLIIAVAKTLNRRSFLQMTYNSMLRHEVKDRVTKQKVKNLDVHTFHSLAVKYYLPTAYTDTGLRYILLNNTPPAQPIKLFNVLVLDEAQDMSFLYYQFMCKVIKDMGSPIQLLILGDYMQGLYEFKGSDTRFLTLAKDIWENQPFLKTREFAHCTMKMSYRITNQMCRFVNEVMLGENRMEACRDGQSVYYACNTKSNLERVVSGEILRLLERGVSPGDIFILGGSVKGSNSNIRQLENALVERNIPCHVPMMEQDKIDERVIDKKVVFSTFHSIKGRQRKYVFVFGFDQSYLQLYARTLPTDICPNTLYVACTRAMEGLYLLERSEYNTDRPLDFLKMGHHELAKQDYIKFPFQPRNQFYEPSPDDRRRIAELEHRHKITPTDLIKFIPESVIEDLSPILDRIFVCITKNTFDIDIPTIIETQQGYFEEVSDLNGIAIPCMYYDILEAHWKTESPKNSLLTIIQHSVENMRPNEHIFLKQIVKELPEEMTTIHDYLYAANVSLSVQETLYSKLKQISKEEHNWLSESVLELCKQRLEKTVGQECRDSCPRIEEDIILQSDEKQHQTIDAFLANHFEKHIKFRFTARTDLITSSTIWELKCTSQLSLDHKLQTLIYAWLWRIQYPDDTRSVKLFNIRTGEIFRLDVEMEELNTIMVLLLKGKFQETAQKTDEEFIQRCTK